MPALGETSSAAAIALRFIRDRPPQQTDDVSLGYIQGSHWTDTANGRTFICTSHQAGQAAWAEVSAAPPPPPSGDSLRFAPPGWIGGDPKAAANYPGFQVINVTGPGTLNLQSGQDYFLIVDAAWSSAPSGRTSININGGRHVVIVGGRVAFTSTNAVDDSTAFLLDGGDTAGIIHIEGVDIASPNGVTIRTPRILQLQNCRVVARVFQDNHSLIHPDVIQVWRGNRCQGIRVHRLSGYSTMQYLADMTDETTPHGVNTPVFWELHDVDLHGLPPLNGSIPLMGLNGWMGYPPLSTFRGTNCWFETSYVTSTTRRGLGDQLRQFGEQYNPKHAGYQIFDENNVLLYTQQPGIASGAPGTAGQLQGHRLRYLDSALHPGLTDIEWRCQLATVADGADGNGNFVSSGVPGVGYVPPGYV